jgi:hypothetical protein
MNQAQKSAALWIWQNLGRFQREGKMIKRHMVHRDHWLNDAQMLELTGKS